MMRVRPNQMVMCPCCIQLVGLVMPSFSSALVHKASPPTRTRNTRRRLLTPLITHHSPCRSHTLIPYACLPAPDPDVHTRDPTAPFRLSCTPRTPFQLMISPCLTSAFCALDRRPHSAAAAACPAAAMNPSTAAGHACAAN